jgi:hypothetical protein
LTRASGGEPAGGAVEVGGRLGRSIADLPAELIAVGRALEPRHGLTRTLNPVLDVLDVVARYA